MFKEINEEKYLDINGVKKGYLLFSNSMEVLFEHLKVNLFSEDQSVDVFAERLLVVPSQGIQQWIQMHMALSLSIASGLNITFLNQATEILREKLFFTQKEYFLPTQLELFLILEQEIEKVMQSKDSIWHPLIAYVKGKERRKIALAKQLSQLFMRYGIYGNKALLNWEKRSQNWQEALWANVFQKWDYPQRVLTRLHKKKIGVTDLNGLSVHLFAFSHISPLHFHFLRTISDEVPVYFYHLSPCQEFWSDLTAESPSLLGGMGRVGREMARLIEESDTPTEEAYVLFGRDTQLKRLQRYLLTLQGGLENREDDSIQIHEAATPHREIENLYQLILKLLSETGAEPKEIIVMAPQITTYAPYIEDVFRAIDYQIADMPMQRSHPLVQGLFLLLDLEKKRWSAPAVFELLNHPLFSKKLNDEELSLIKKWVHETGIRWGVDGQHRATLLKKSHCINAMPDGSSTWLNGLGRLIDELALPPSDPSRPPRIDFSQAETLGNAIVFIEKLFADLRALDEAKGLKEWVHFLKQMLETYFILPEESKAILSTIDKIEMAGRHFPDKLYTFPLIYALLKDHLGQEYTTVNRNNTQTVRFCSMLPMRALPAKIICLIGMNLDTFPRREELGSLDLLKGNGEADYFPSRIDFDRYLFLEAVLSAREKLIISYLGQDPLDLSELPPSSVVTDLLSCIGGKQLVKHPIHNLNHVRIEPAKPFSIKITPSVTLPQGEYVIETAELSRLARSSLSHFLHFQGLKIFDEKLLQEEEPFILAPIQRAILRKKALLEGAEAAFEKGEREGSLPSALFGTLAKGQLEEEIAALPKQQLKQVPLPSFRFEVNSALTINFTGVFEGVYSEGLCVPYKSDFRSAVKAWPLFILLNTFDRSKRELLFAASNEVKGAFFEDPRPFLRAYIDYYFYAKENPFPLVPEWVEPLLKKDPKKLEQAVVYDPYLEWQLKGRSRMDYEELVASSPVFVDQIYREMLDAWF